MLELLLYKNRFQLVTNDVLYSDGDKYLPAVIACDYFKKYLPSFKNVLVLGTGMGSLVQVMARMGHTPGFTLVELDEKILEWALEFMPDNIAKNLDPICIDAGAYMAGNTRKFDFVFIDVFNNRTVPDFVFAAPFLRQCRECLLPGGHIAFNYIVNSSEDWVEVQQVFGQIFPGFKVISRSVNKILVC